MVIGNLRELKDIAPNAMLLQIEEVEALPP
jgi:hypothetical protein